MLTKELSIELVNAGLTKLRVSIQGINAEKYEKISETKLNFEKLVENLRYFYENKNKTQIYIKIIDFALEENEDKDFFRIFGDICDAIAIEHLSPAVPQIDYSAISRANTNKLTQNGATIQDAEICPQPFYLMQINPEGNVVPCCSMETAYVAGNIKTESLYDIWNGKRFYEFRKTQLLKQKEIYSVCRECQQYKYAMFPEDVLDDDAERLLELFKPLQV
jgi:radical SAM protein with 4Fe4S-binding SPASM domain